MPRCRICGDDLVDGESTTCGSCLAAEPGSKPCPRCGRPARPAEVLCDGCVEGAARAVGIG